MDPKLYKAARDGQMEDLRRIMAGSCPPDLTLCLTPQKNTALHIAVKFQQQEIVQWIIQMQLPLMSFRNSKGDTPLHMAARAGFLDLTKLLTPALNLNLMVENPALEEGNPVQWTAGVALMMKNLEGSNPIHEALKKSHEEVALYLLAFDEGHHLLARDVNLAGESLLYLAAEAGLYTVVRKIIETGAYSTGGPDGQNPLHIAVIKGRLEVVQVLVDKASNLIPQVDGFGNTVLHYASAPSYYRVLEEDKDEGEYWSEGYEHWRILELLLEANPSLAYVPNRNGDYPLFIAIRNNFHTAVDSILCHCRDSAELVNQKGQNALHLAVTEKNPKMIAWFGDEMLINEPDNDGNTPMHLATRTDRYDIVKDLIAAGHVDLTMSNKEGQTAMDICGYTEREHPIRHILRRSGAVPSRHRWRGHATIPLKTRILKISPEFKEAIRTLPIVTTLVATVTFAAAFTVPGGYNNDSPHEGLPVLMRNAALLAFVLSDILAFCSSMVATVLLVYANAHSEDAFLISSALKTCYYISGVAILATITAFVTAVYVLTSKESLWLAVTSLILGFAVPLLLFWYKNYLEAYRLVLLFYEVEYKFVRDHVPTQKLSLMEKVDIQADRIGKLWDFLSSGISKFYNAFRRDDDR